MADGHPQHPEAAGEGLRGSAALPAERGLRRGEAGQGKGEGVNLGAPLRVTAQAHVKSCIGQENIYC